MEEDGTVREEEPVTEAPAGYIATTGKVDFDKELEFQMQRTNKSLLRGWDVRIEHLDHGVIVTIGCKKLAFSSTDEAMLEVAVWMTDPKAMLKKWFKKLHE
jgi:hypothetical protein